MSSVNIEGETASESAVRLLDTWRETGLDPFMREHGWRRVGNEYRMRHGDNTSYVRLVRSKWNTPMSADCKLDLSVFSPRLALLQAAAHGLPVSRPSGYAGQFVTPLGLLMGHRTDLWWQFHRRTSEREMKAYGETAREGLTRHGFAWLDQHSTDERLRDLLLGRFPEVSPTDLGYLARLLQDLGPIDRLAEVTAALGSTPRRTPWIEGLIRETE